MKCRESFFNRGLIKSDIKRFWWFSALYTVADFLAYTMPLLTANNVLPMADGTIQSSKFISYSFVPIYLSVFLPVIMAALLFGYLQKNASVSAAHSLPLKRKTLFFSHLASGIMLVLAPIIINTLIILVLRSGSRFMTSYPVSYFLNTVAMVAIYSIVTFSWASLVSMLSGSVIASIILSFIIGLLPSGAETYILYLLQKQLYGYYNDGSMPISRFLYKTPFEAIEWQGIVLYLGLSVLFVILGYIIYKTRKLEKNGEVVAFSALRPLFVIGVGVCAGAVGYSYFSEVWLHNNILFHLPIGILGFIVAEMIVKKSVKIPKIYKPLIVYTVAVVAVFGMFETDIFGYERRVPQAEDVQSVTFIDEYGQTEPTCYDQNGRQAVYDNVGNSEIKDIKDIEKLVKYHEALVSNRYDGEDQSQKIRITYSLKDGKTLVRQYCTDFEMNTDELRSVAEIEAVKEAYLPILRNNDKISVITVADDRLSTSFMDLSLENMNKEQIDEFKEALVKDLKAADGAEIAKNYPTMTYFYISGSIPAHYLNGEKVPENAIGEETRMYYIRPEYENTVKLLEDYGFYSILPSAEDIEKIEVMRYDEKYTETKPYVLTERNDLAEVYKYITEVTGKTYNSRTSLCIYYNNGVNQWVSLCDNGTVPECLAR